MLAGMDERVLRLTPAEQDQVEAALDAEPRAIPELAAARRCDRCLERTPTMVANYPELTAGGSVADEEWRRPLRWCDECAGPSLAVLVALGYTVMVRPVDAG
jgi:hypothetical protein